jgi:hypothetical protein
LFRDEAEGVEGGIGEGCTARLGFKFHARGQAAAEQRENRQQSQREQQSGHREFDKREAGAAGGAGRRGSLNAKSV